MAKAKKKHITEAPPSPLSEKLQYDEVWISDIHLLSDYSDPRLLLEFLENSEIKKLRIIGDFIDIWHLQGRDHAKVPEMHARVLDKILQMAEDGTDVLYVPGNHDEEFRTNGHFDTPVRQGEENPYQHSDDYLGEFHGITLKRKHIEESSDGKKTLFVHGDGFDPVLRKWIYEVGDRAYGVLMKANAALNGMVPDSRSHHYSIARAIKKGVKKGVKVKLAKIFGQEVGINIPGVIHNFEEKAAASARRYNVDRIACGHIHAPENRMISGIQYVNTGDFVDHCSLFAFPAGGQEGQIVHWPRLRTELGFSRLPKKSDPK